MLLLGRDAPRAQDAVSSYIQAVDSGMDSVEAFEQCFGPIDEVEEELRRYVFRKTLTGLVMDAPPQVEESSFRERKLVPGESEALRANFLVYGTRPDNAIPLVEKALASDPGSALAMETLGFYYFRKQSWDEAEQWYRRAIAQESPGTLSHFFFALVVLRRDGRAELGGEHLRKAVAANPKLAPAQAHLGRLYADQGANLEKAYAHALEAVRLDPSEIWHWVNLGRILLKMDRLADACKLEERARHFARSEASRKLLASFARDVERYQTQANPTSSVVQDR